MSTLGPHRDLQRDVFPLLVGAILCETRFRRSQQQLLSLGSW